MTNNVSVVKSLNGMDKSLSVVIIIAQDEWDHCKLCLNLVELSSTNQQRNYKKGLPSSMLYSHFVKSKDLFIVLKLIIFQLS